MNISDLFAFGGNGIVGLLIVILSVIWSIMVFLLPFMVWWIARQVGKSSTGIRDLNNRLDQLTSLIGGGSLPASLLPSTENIAEPVADAVTDPEATPVSEPQEDSEEILEPEPIETTVFAFESTPSDSLGEDDLPPSDEAEAVSGFESPDDDFGLSETISEESPDTGEFDFEENFSGDVGETDEFDLSDTVTSEPAESEDFNFEETHADPEADTDDFGLGETGTGEPAEEEDFGWQESAAGTGNYEAGEEFDPDSGGWQWGLEEAAPEKEVAVPEEEEAAFDLGTTENEDSPKQADAGFSLEIDEASFASGETEKIEVTPSSSSPSIAFEDDPSEDPAPEDPLDLPPAQEEADEFGLSETIREDLGTLDEGDEGEMTDKEGDSSADRSDRIDFGFGVTDPAPPSPWEEAEESLEPAPAGGGDLEESHQDEQAPASAAKIGIPVDDQAAEEPEKADDLAAAFETPSEAPAPPVSSPPVEKPAPDITPLPGDPRRPEIARALCGECGHRLAYKKVFSGKKGRCPSCQTAFRLP